MSVKTWLQRLPFTRQESTVILFLLVSLLVGGVVFLLRGYRPLEVSSPEETRSIQRPDIAEMVEKTTQDKEEHKRKLEGKININTASAGEFQLLPRIGPSLSQRILAYREAQGGFKSIEDLKEVKGIGDKTFQRIREHITVE